MKIIPQIALVLLLAAVFVHCGQDQEKEPDNPGLAKQTPHDLTYETATTLVNDMKNFSDAVRSLKEDRLKVIDARYRDVFFRVEEKPLFINVYPDPASNAVIFLLAPKDPRTGANFLLTFDQKLPVTDTDTLELQIRTPNPEQPLQCKLEVADPQAYMKERIEHDYGVTYVLAKKFLQSGTYDFDALTVPSYRARGYPFIVFDLVKAEITDKTANLTAACQ